MDTHTVAFPESQASPHSPVEESLLPHSTGPESKISRVKVCPECGMVFYKTQRYKLHVSSHRPMLNCDMCSFKTKEPKKLKTHKLSHKKDNPDNECYICHKYFLTDVTLRIHQKRIHNVHVCKYCNIEYSSEEELRNHMREQHGYTRKLKGYVELSDPKQINLQTTNEISDVDKSQLTCKFCKKISRTKYQLNLHLAQHLGTSSKEISDGLLDKSNGLQKQRNQCQVSNESKDSRVEFETRASSDEITTFNAAVKCEVMSEEDADTEDKAEVLPPVCNTLFKQPSPSLGQTLLFCNPVGQPVSVMRSNSTLQSPIPNTTNELMRPEVIPAVDNTSFKELSTVPNIPSGQTLLICNPVGQSLPIIRPHFLLQSPTLNTTNELTVSPYTHASSAVCVPPVQPSVCVPSVQPTTFQYSTTPAVMSVPEVTPSTSFSSNMQTSATKVLIPTQEKQAEKDKEYSPFWCVYCATGFPTPGDLKKHSVEVHPSQPVPKVLLPRMVKKQIFEEYKTQKPKKRKAKRELPCDVCGEVCYSSKALRNHKKKHRKSFMCPDCNIVYKSSHKLLRHQKLYHKEKYRCRFACGVLFDSYTEVIIHYKRVHDKDYSRIECPHCQKGFIYEASLMNHLEKCKDCPPDKRPAHVCGNCEGFFCNIDTYNKHAKICLPSLKKKDLSENMINTSKNLAKSTRDILENFASASDDDSDTSDSSDSSIEERSASVPYEFRRKRPTGFANCKYCPNVLIEKDKEVSHILSLHKDLVTRMTEAPRKCEICGIIFKIDKALCKHLLKHYSKLNMWDALVPQDILKLVTVKNYCWICKSTYRWPRNTDHGIKRDICIDEAFESEEFDEVVVVPLKCETCNQSFSTRKEFWIHVKNHISILPRKFFKTKPPQSTIQSKLLECTECHYKCKKMNDLYKHLTDHFIEEIKETKVSEKIDKNSSSEQIGKDTDMDR